MAGLPENAIIQGNALDVLRTLPEGSVQMCVTSPPYWNLRDYGVEGQIGLEPTIEEYIAHLVEIFREVRRVLRPDGVFFLNMGDSYANSATSQHKSNGGLTGNHALSPYQRIAATDIGLKPKDLCLIPSRLAIALQADGWWLRSMIPWLKQNSMPESVTDRPATAVEYVFLLTKSARYYYDGDAVRVPSKDPQDDIRRINQQHEGNKSMVTDKINGLRPRKIKMPDGWDTGKGAHGSYHRQGREKGKTVDRQRRHVRRHAGLDDRWDAMSKEEQCANGRNRRNSDWFFESFRGLYQVDEDPLALIVNPVPMKEAHFATFPPGLIRPMIRAGSRPGDVVLDPFMGAGTTALVCERLERKWIGIELNPEYIEIAEARLKPYREQQKLALTDKEEVE